MSKNKPQKKQWRPKNGNPNLSDDVGRERRPSNGANGATRRVASSGSNKYACLANSLANGLAQAQAAGDAVHARLDELEEKLEPDPVLPMTKPRCLAPTDCASGGSSPLGSRELVPCSNYPNNPPDDNGGSGGHLSEPPPTDPLSPLSPMVINQPYLACTPEATDANTEPDITGFARMHFGVLGYNLESYKSANARTMLWLNRKGVKDSNITDHIAQVALRQVWQVYYDRWDVAKWYEWAKLACWDWWKRNRFYLLGGVVSFFGLANCFSKKMRMTSVVAGMAIGVLGVFHSRPRSAITTIKCAKLGDYCTRTSSVDIDIDDKANVLVAPIDKCVETTFQVGFTINPGMVWIPRLCGHNELNALVNRQLLPAIGEPHVRKFLWDTGCQALMKQLAPVDVCTKLSRDQMFTIFAARCPLGRRQCLNIAYLGLNNNLRMAECITKAFVKREWLVGKLLNKRNPRLISGKTDDYLAETGPEYYCWMKVMCDTYWSSMTIILTQKYIYTGGLTGDQVGYIYTHFVLLGWEVVEGDFSRYDGHNEIEALNAEMDYYDGALPPDVTSALRRQYTTTGRTQSGHKFKCQGKVASGVINTSFGNTLRGFMIVAAWCELNSIVDFCVMQLGDDNIIFVKDIEQFNLPGFVTHCYNMGHKLEAIHRPDPDYGEFCSQRFWNTGEQYVLGPKPARVLAKTFITHDPTLTNEDMAGYCQQIALGFKHFTWIPVMGVFIDRWARHSCRLTRKTKAFMKREAASQFHKIQLRREISVDPNSVISQFVKIYGFDPAELEMILSNIPLSTGVAYQNDLLDHMCSIDGVGTQETNFFELAWKNFSSNASNISAKQYFD